MLYLLFLGKDTSKQPTTAPGNCTVIALFDKYTENKDCKHLEHTLKELILKPHIALLFAVFALS